MKFLTKNTGQQTLLTAAEIEESFGTELIEICPVIGYAFDFPVIQTGLP